MSNMRFVDISHWQSGVDIQKLLGKVDAIIMKATESTTYADPTFERFTKAAIAAKKPFGFYHFFRGNGRKEAEFFYAKTKRFNGAGIPILDVEAQGGKADVQAFVTRYHELTGIYPWVYVSAGAISKYINAFVKDKCALWVAGYPTAATTWTHAGFPYRKYTAGCKVVAWQFTSSLNLGLGVRLDANIGYLDADQWAQYAGKPSDDLKVDGKWGPVTTKAVQKWLGTKQDGKVSHQRKRHERYLTACSPNSWKFSPFGSSPTIKALQRKLRVKDDGLCGPVTITALQNFLGVKSDGVCGTETVKALQRYLNKR